MCACERVYATRKCPIGCIAMAMSALLSLDPYGNFYGFLKQQQKYTKYAINKHTWFFCDKTLIYYTIFSYRMPFYIYLIIDSKNQYKYRYTNWMSATFLK